MSTGTIYHHLENLADLIDQRSDKKYYLTEIGEHAYSSLKNNIIKKIGTPDVLSREFKSPLLRGLMAITPKKLIISGAKTNSYIFIIIILISFFGAIFSALAQSVPFLLFFIEIPDNIIGLPILVPILIFFGFFLNYGVFFLIIEGICRLFYNKNKNSLKLCISFVIIMFPMSLYAIFHLIWLNQLSIAFFGILDRILLITLQVWSLWLLTYSLSVKKDLKMENGLIISLLLHYMSFTVILFISI